MLKNGPTISILCYCFCSYSEELQSLLWPRFKHILTLNVASVREADPSKLGHIDTRPHYVRMRRERERFSKSFLERTIRSPWYFFKMAITQKI